MQLQDPTPPRGQRAYVQFFWPLSLLGIAMLGGRMVQNYVLLGFEEGVEELAWFALALAVFGPLASGIGMVPQMVTVWGRTPETRWQCLRFVTLLCVILSAPILILAWTPMGLPVVSALFRLPADAGTVIVRYLRFLSPTLFVAGWRQYMVGVLIYREQTGWVTVLKVIDLVAVVAALLLGIHLQLAPSAVVGLSIILPPGVGLICSLILILRKHPMVEEEEGRSVTVPALFRYFWPLAATTFMFTLSRPIIYRFIRALNPEDDPDGIDTTAIIAAISLAFTVGLVFQVTVNQIRHLMVKYGKTDPRGVRRFILWVATTVTVLMVGTLVTPLARLFVQYAQGAEEPILGMTIGCLWVLTCVPAVIAWRNYYHGLAMVHRRTGVMALGGLARNGSIIVAGLLFLSFGALNHLTAASLLVISFAAEALTVVLCSRSWRQDMG